MIPYWKFQGFHPGLPLAAIGILVCHFRLLRRVRRQGLDGETAGMMSLVMVVTGLAAAYWFRGVYFADAVRADWKTLLRLQPGAASFGGIAGGLAGGWLYLLARGLRGRAGMKYLDALAYVFPQGWIFGRLGCTLVHDHPGIRTTSWLAVRYPDAPRFDLGLLELLFFLLVLIPGFAWLDRTKRPTGYWMGTFLTVYGAFRLLLDQLHVDPPRYGWFTVDQWAYGTAFAAGVCLLTRSVFQR